MFKKFYGVRIAATGSHLPETILSNNDLREKFGLNMSSEQMETILGVKERRAAAENEVCSDLIAEAARRIIESAGISALDIDRIFVSAVPGDGITPPTAAVVQKKIGAKCPATDIGMACTGWLAGIEAALLYLTRNDGEKRILVMGGTILSRGVSWENPLYRAIFGDAAAGVLLEKCPENEENFWYTQLWTDGDYHDTIFFPAEWSVYPPTILPTAVRGFHMAEKKVFFKVLEETMGPFMKNFWKKSNLTPEKIDVALIHQPSLPLFQKGLQESGIDPDKVLQDLLEHGNTIAAEQPLLLDEAICAGKIKRGDIVLLLTYGAGFTGGVGIFRY